MDDTRINPPKKSSIVSIWESFFTSVQTKIMNIQSPIKQEYIQKIKSYLSKRRSNRAQMDQSPYHPTPTSHNLYFQPLTSRLTQCSNQLHLTPCSSRSSTISEDDELYIFTSEYNTNIITKQKTTKASLPTSLVERTGLLIQQPIRSKPKRISEMEKRKMIILANRIQIQEPIQKQEMTDINHYN